MTAKKCFFISRIGDAGTKEREQSDYIFKLLKEVLTYLNYNRFERSDFISKTGNITQQIIELILDSDLVIADLSGENANVFYELGIRHATSKPFVQIKDDKGEIPFDLSQVRTIIYKYDLSKKCIEDHDRKKFCDVLISFIRQGELHPFDVKSPISAIDSITPLKNDSQPIERIMADIIQIISNGMQLFIPLNIASVPGMTQDSYAPFLQSTREVLLDIRERIRDLRRGVIVCSGPLINSTFKNFMDYVENEFIAVSVNDFNFWLRGEGDLYLNVTLRHKELKPNVKLERIFVIKDGMDLDDNHKNKIFKNQIEKGYSLRFVFESSLIEVVDNVNRLDFGLFDNYAVSFFRATKGRTYTVSTSKDRCDRYRRYYEDICYHCIPVSEAPKKKDEMLPFSDNSLIKNLDEFEVVYKKIKTQLKTAKTSLEQ